MRACRLSSDDRGEPNGETKTGPSFHFPRKEVSMFDCFETAPWVARERWDGSDVQSTQNHESGKSHHNTC